jgi:4-diphosphocytidyl-2-C-methyl-D-erythritol kinase
VNTASASGAAPRSQSLLARAKLNLSLRVLARESGGYHQIETLFCLIELADEVEVQRGGAAVSLEIEAPPEQTGAPPDLGPTAANLAYRAAALFCAHTGTADGARIRLVKRVPHGAGLGGGSSDAAAVLSALNALHDRPLTGAQLIELGSVLGSDVPFFLTGAGLAFAWGRGSRMTALPSLPAQPVLLALSEQRVATAAAYAALDVARADTYVAPAGTVRLWPTCWSDLLSGAVNDFEAVVFERLPQLATVREALERRGARLARLTGTGSAVFALYDDTATLAAARAELAAEFPDTRFVTTATVTL